MIKIISYDGPGGISTTHSQVTRNLKEKSKSLRNILEVTVGGFSRLPLATPKRENFYSVVRQNRLQNPGVTKLFP